nr:MAG TPA: hypothetical protein [Ackermannviridae sp.]
MNFLSLLFYFINEMNIEQLGKISNKNEKFYFLIA